MLTGCDRVLVSCILEFVNSILSVVVVASGYVLLCAVFRSLLLLLLSLSLSLSLFFWPTSTKPVGVNMKLSNVQMVATTSHSGVSVCWKETAFPL